MLPRSSFSAVFLALRFQRWLLPLLGRMHNVSLYCWILSAYVDGYLEYGHSPPGASASFCLYGSRGRRLNVLSGACSRIFQTVCDGFSMVARFPCSGRIA
jgi:hypothetical protein